MPRANASEGRDLIRRLKASTGGSKLGDQRVVIRECMTIVRESTELALGACAYLRQKHVSGKRAGVQAASRGRGPPPAPASRMTATVVHTSINQ